MNSLDRKLYVIGGFYLLPFMLGGILLAGKAYGWFYYSVTGDWRQLLFLLGLAVFAVGIYLGALVGYGVLVFFLTWLAPRSPLLALEYVEKPTLKQRVLGPPFLAVRRLAEWLAPRRSRSKR